MSIFKFENLPSKNTPITDKVLEGLQTNLLKMVFPVGSIYWNANPLVNPGEELGFGEWELREGVCFFSASRTDSDYYIGEKGGETRHTLSISEVPKHSHRGQATYNDSNNIGNAAVASGGSYQGIIAGGAGVFSVANEGGGQPHENRPPFEVNAFAWVRIA